MQVEEERQARSEFVDLESALERLLDVADAVGDGEGEFLHRGRAGFADMVAGDRNRVPSRSPLRAELDHVGNDPHRGSRRADPFLLRDELLEHVVLDRAADLLPRHALALGHDQIHRQQNRCRAVDRHRGADLVQRDAVEQPGHVMDRRDRNAFAADLANRALVVGVVTHQGRHVEGGGESVLSLAQQIVEPRVGVLGQAEARELAHRPEPPAIHRTVNAARVRILARISQRPVVVAVALPTEHKAGQAPCRIRWRSAAAVRRPAYKWFRAIFWSCRSRPTSIDFRARYWRSRGAGSPKSLRRSR